MNMRININYKLKIAFILMLFTMSGGIFAQNITVSGVVTDAQTKELITGASIIVKGTTTGTFSDENGRYSITAPKNAVIVSNLLGYESQSIAATSGIVNFAMVSQDFQMDDVVVVGTVMKKSDLTGAVGSVSEKVLSEKPVTNINQAIQGRVAGVLISNGSRPGDDSSIKIRGINTINTSSDPIYVVDGLVMDNFASGFNTVNVNDVASVEILKDASATALYGSRGSNGVVVITTKKGQRGEGKVSYDAWFGVQEFAKTPKRMGTQDLFDLRRDAAVNGYRAVYPDASAADVANYLTNSVMTGNKVFADYEFDAYNNNKSYNWLDEVTRTGLQQNHVLSFSGGSDKGNYYLSFGYGDQKGLMQNSGQVKYTGRINMEQQVKPWLKVGTNTTYTYTKDEIVDDGVMNRARNANPMLAIDKDVSTINYQGHFDQNLFNPIRSLKVDQNRNRNRVLSSNFLNINPIKGLNIRTSISIDYVEQKDFKYTPKDIYESIRYSLDGEAKHSRDSRTTWQWDNTISYDKTFGKHKINALLGTSTTSVNRNYTYANGKGFLTDDLGYYNIGNAYKKNEREIGSDFTTEKLASYLARANYSYDNKYSLTATARYDGSSKFGIGNQWGLFPSFSGAWDIAKESFMTTQSMVDQFKLRVGFGIVGNQNIDNYAYQTLYNINITKKEDGSYESMPVSNGRRGTPNIKWEKQKQYNIGVDTRILNSRVGLSVDAFFIENKDLLMTRTLALTTGYGKTIENIGTIENKGIELTFDANIIKTKDFQWNASINLSADRNKITKLYGQSRELLNIDGDRNIQKEGNLFLGESRNTIYIWRTGGIAQAADLASLGTINWNGYDVGAGDLYPLDVNGDKSLDDADRVIIGSADPKFYGGFSTDFTWKGFSINSIFTYSSGAKKLSPYYENLISSNGTGVASVDLKDRWTPENTGAEFPRPILLTEKKKYQNYSASQMDFSVQDASFLRLSTLTLSYTVPQNVVNKLKLGTLRVYTTGSNLFCLTKYKGYDPETGDWYPPTRMYVLGVNVSF